MEQWYISDTHFHHENIIRFSGRPFSNAKEMDDYMITQWNERVKETDHITHLGDVTMERGSRGSPQAMSLKRLIKSLNGHKRLLLGNHDHFPIEVYLGCGFEKIYATHKNEHNWLLSHFPIHPSNLGPVEANIHGHIHDHESPAPAIFGGYKTVWNTDSSGFKGRVIPYINISVEKTAYGPINVDEVKAMIRLAIEKHKESEDGESNSVSGAKLTDKAEE